jgi:hypothetical protein
MLIDPRGYRIVELVHESSATLVFRAERERERRLVVLKALKPEAATPAAAAGYRHEHDVLHGLRLSGVIEVLGLEVVQGMPMLVLEDFGAESLARLHRTQRFSLARALVLAARIADILSELHHRGIVHGDISPANILLDPVHDVLKIADFGSSLVAPGARLSAQSQPRPAMTLAYMSPEQTGRMDRPVDHRTDFYSLGVSLYELCTGRLPFATDDPLQLLHSHLARQPAPPHLLDAGVPEALSDIVLKLMAKMPEDRYQSGRGCAHDLRECLRRLREHGSIERFALGEGDDPAQLQIPARLYGRASELAAVTGAFARAAAGARHLVLVKGAPGIGKSALVRELAEPIARHHGYLLTGKFDQFRRNVPYSAFAQAFGGLVGQILAQAEERVERWRSALRASLGPSGPALIEVIPDLSHLIGAQPPLPRLGLTETEHRFTHAFQRFLEVACRSEHPLAVFATACSRSCSTCSATPSSSRPPAAPSLCTSPSRRARPTARCSASTSATLASASPPRSSAPSSSPSPRPAIPAPPTAAPASASPSPPTWWPSCRARSRSRASPARGAASPSPPASACGSPRRSPHPRPIAAPTPPPACASSWPRTTRSTRWSPRGS